MMITDSETQTMDPHREGSHAFPQLNNKASTVSHASSAEADHCFKPLYNAAPSSGELSPHKGIVASCTGEDLNSEDAARRKAFERGLQAGRRDACSLVQQEAAPQVKSFADAFNRWNAAMMRIEEESHLRILKTAASIAEKILGAAPQCCDGRLETMKDGLKAHLRKSYQLEFSLNPNDLDALSGLTACADVHWGQWEYITAAARPDVQSGTLGMQTDPRSPLDLEGLLGPLDASLSEVSTK